MNNAITIDLAVTEYVETCEIDCNSIVHTNALSALDEIKSIICNTEPDDFMKIDKITNVFVKYNIDIGGCHDF